MSITVNDKGGSEQRVNLVKRGGGETQHVMLNNTLIKKAQNYFLVVDRFLTNELPGIIQKTRQLIEIRPRGAAGVLNSGFAPGAFLGARNTYTPPAIFSTGRLCESLSQFFKHFNFGLYIYGANYSNSANPSHIAYTQAVYGQGGPYDLRNVIPPDQVTNYISLGFESDGRLLLVMSSEFLSNFFIVLDEIFAKQVGLPTQIYSGVTNLGAVVMSNQPGCLPLLAANNTFQIPSGVLHGVSVVSTESIFRVDDRLSIDIEMTLPLTGTIDVHHTKEERTYLLSRFQVKDYVRIKSRAQQRGGFLLTKTLVYDLLQSGFVDLVANIPETHTAQLTNGHIRELDLRLILRYKEFSIINNILTYSIGRKSITMGHDGSYDLLLSFNKRV